MTDDRHRRVIELFTEALGIPAERRRLFVDAQAGADTELAAEVHAMLAADAQGAERLDVGAAGALGALDDDLPGFELSMEFAGFVLLSEPRRDRSAS